MRRMVELDRGLEASCDGAVASWGGTQMREHPQLNDGAAFDPSTNRWRVLAPSPLAGRYGHTAVWTGSQMIVWGGTDEGPSDAIPHRLADGATYDPETDVWALLPNAPLAGYVRTRTRTSDFCTRGDADVVVAISGEAAWTRRRRVPTFLCGVWRRQSWRPRPGSKVSR